LSGNWIWVETKATNLLDDPAVKGIVCNSKDITERIEQEELLRENIERFNTVSKATSDIIWDCNFAENVIIWNKALKGILKYDLGGRTSLDWWKNKIHPEDKKRVLDSLEHCIAQKTSKWQEDYRFLCNDGHYKYIFDRGFVLLNDDGIPYRMIGAMQDITKRKEEEQWSKLLESVVINTSDGVLITDAGKPNPKIVYVNASLIEMSGYTKEELIGNTPDILHGSYFAQRELTKLKFAIRSKKSCKVELVNVTKQGIDYHVWVSISPVFNADGEVTSWISIQRDVSEERKYVNAIEEQNKISWLQSHVVRAPLARIMSLVELLENTPDQCERKELTEYLRKSADELDEIITNIANQTKDESLL
jgi:PAS domain S-box-containing protein